jgi:predicted metal-dependent hydrolase
MFGRRGVISSMLPVFLHYFNPRFHPWKGTDGAAIARWQSANARCIVNVGCPARTASG